MTTKENKFRIFFFLGFFILIFSLIFWLIFVEGNKQYLPGTRIIGVIIFAVSIVLFFYSGILHRKAKINNE